MQLDVPDMLQIVHLDCSYECFRHNNSLVTNFKCELFGVQRVDKICSNSVHSVHQVNLVLKITTKQGQSKPFLLYFTYGK